MDFVQNVGRRSDTAGDNGQFIHVGIFSLNGYERNALYCNRGVGRFFDVGYLEGADRVEDGRGMGLLDADMDGDPDIIIANYAQPARLLINHAPPETHWLRLALEGTRSSRMPVGARVELRSGTQRQFRQVSLSGGYLSGQSPYLHFGLGIAKSVDDLIIHWPSGAVQELRDVPADRLYWIREGQQLPSPERNQPAGPATAVR
jgi:hypothetical protein